MKVNNIAVSLSLGQLLHKKHFVTLYLGMAISLLFPAITIALLFFPQIISDNQLLYALITGNIIFVSFFCVLVYVKVKDTKIKKTVTIWLEDAIQLQAHCKKVDQIMAGMQPKAVKIKVTFKLDDKVFSKVSTAKVFGGQSGYLGTFTKYADKDVVILYSPRYDEVLIVKEC